MNKKQEEDLLARLDALEQKMAEMEKIVNRPPVRPVQGLVTSLPQKVESTKGT